MRQHRALDLGGSPSPASPRPNGAPCYGQDNHYLDGELPGTVSHEIQALAEEDVI